MFGLNLGVRCAKTRSNSLTYRMDGIQRIAPVAHGVRSLLPSMAGRACKSMSRASQIKYLNRRRYNVDERHNERVAWFI